MEKYEIIHRLGSGGCGSVHLARDRETKKYDQDMHKSKPSSINASISYSFLKIQCVSNHIK